MGIEGPIPEDNAENISSFEPGETVYHDGNPYKVASSEGSQVTLMPVDTETDDRFHAGYLTVKARDLSRKNTEG